MFSIKNNTERLITTHLGDMLAPGATTEVSDVTMEHPTMQQWSSEGHITATEIVDPPITTRAHFTNPPKDEPVKEVPPENNQPSPVFNTGDVEQPHKETIVAKPSPILPANNPSPITAAQTTKA